MVYLCFQRETKALCMMTDKIALYFFIKVARIIHVYFNII